MGGFNLARLNNKHFLSVVGNGLVAFIGIATMIVLYRGMPKADAGNWVFFFSILSICDAVRNGFLGTATVKFYAGTEKDRGAEVLGSIWFLAIAITLAVAALNGLCLLLVPFISHTGLLISFKWLGLTFISTMPFSVTYWVQQADEQYDKMLYLKLVNSCSTIAVYAVLIYLHKLSLDTALLYNFVTNCLTSIVGLVWRQGGITTLARRSRNSIMEVVHYGKYSLATNLSANLLRNVDNFFVEGFLGPEMLAIYSIPVKLMEVIEIPLRSFVGTGMSGMAIAFNNNNMYHLTHILKKYTGMLTLAFIPMIAGGIVLADVGVAIFSKGYTFSDAAFIFRIFLVVSLMYPLDRFLGVTLDIIHQPKINFYKVIIMLVVNIIGDYVGILLFHNIYGVIIFNIVTNLSGIIYGHVQLRKHITYTIGGIYKTGAEETMLLARKWLKMG